MTLTPIEVLTVGLLLALGWTIDRLPKGLWIMRIARLKHALYVFAARLVARTRPRRQTWR